MKTINFLDGTVLYIENSVLMKMFQYIQTRESDTEAGGILLGKQLENREEYILSDISEPKAKDKRKRFSFVRDKRSAQFVINKAWKETKGVTNYLGEWHSHPESNPIPSNTDRNLIQQVINDRSNVFTKVFLIIIGLDKSMYIGLANSNISNNIILSVEIGGAK